MRSAPTDCHWLLSFPTRRVLGQQAEQAAASSSVARLAARFASYNCRILVLFLRRRTACSSISPTRLQQFHELLPLVPFSWWCAFSENATVALWLILSHLARPTGCSVLGQSVTVTSCPKMRRFHLNHISLHRYRWPMLARLDCRQRASTTALGFHSLQAHGGAAGCQRRAVLFRLDFREAAAMKWASNRGTNRGTPIPMRPFFLWTFNRLFRCVVSCTTTIYP